MSTFHFTLSSRQTEQNATPPAASAMERRLPHHLASTAFRSSRGRIQLCTQLLHGTTTTTTQSQQIRFFFPHGLRPDAASVAHHRRPSQHQFRSRSPSPPSRFRRAFSRTSGRHLSQKSVWLARGGRTGVFRSAGGRLCGDRPPRRRRAPLSSAAVAQRSNSPLPRVSGFGRGRRVSSPHSAAATASTAAPGRKKLEHPSWNAPPPPPPPRPPPMRSRDTAAWSCD